MGSILGPTWVCHFSQVESSTSGFTSSGGSSSVSMVGIQVIFVNIRLQCIFHIQQYIGNKGFFFARLQVESQQMVLPPQIVLLIFPTLSERR